MKIWFLYGCDGLMACVVRAATEQDARQLAADAFNVTVESIADFGCDIVKHGVIEGLIVVSDRRP